MALGGGREKSSLIPGRLQGVGAQAPVAPFGPESVALPSHPAGGLRMGWDGLAETPGISGTLSGQLLTSPVNAGPFDQG